MSSSRSSRSSSNNSSPADGPAANKRQCTELDYLTFTASDESGACGQFALSHEVWSKVPYLDRKISTDVGSDNDDDRRRVLLPTGCTVDAFDALVRKVGPNNFVSAHLQATSLNEAVTLLRTADFMLLEDFVPEIVSVCRRNVETVEDLALVRSIPIAAMQELSKEMAGGRLAARMSAKAVGAVAAGLDNPSVSRVSDAQAKVLYDWLRKEVRSENDLNKVLGTFSSGFGTWFQRQDAQLELKQNAGAWVQMFASLAAERSDYFCIFRILTDPMHSNAHWFDSQTIDAFLSALLLPFQDKKMNMDEVEVLISSVLRHPFTRDPERILECLYAQSFTAEELKVILPKIKTFNQYSWASGAILRILTNSEAVIDKNGVRELMGCSEWWKSLTVPFLSMLNPDLQLDMVERILPKLERSDAPSAEVKKYIEDSIASGKF